MSVAVVMLAAGQSKRFKNIKQLADVFGKTLVQHCLEQFLPKGQPIKGVNKVNLVLGSNYELIQPIISKAVNIVTVENWHLGMGHSLAEAMIQIDKAPINQIDNEPTHVLIALADQVAINIDIVNRMLLTSREHPSKIVAARFKNSIGPPVIFPAAYFKQLKELSGDRGAKRVIQQNLENVMCLAIPEAVLDIDTPEDLLSYKTNNIH
jgi:molybdenum cofactor cytidylyltransferase